MAERSAKTFKDSDRKNQFVLVADDDPHRLSCISILLGRFGYQVLKARTFKEVLELANKGVPRLILIALDLPDGAGFKLINVLRDDRKTLHIPVLGVMRGHNADMKNRCLEHGAAGCLCHPVDPETFYRKVQIAMEKNPRTSMRVRTVHPVKIYGKTQDNLYGAYTIALSAGGMFLRTMNPLAVNAELALELNLNGRSIAADAVVVYNCQTGGGPGLESGIGLRFVGIAPGDRNFIRDFVRNDIMKGITSADDQQ